MNELVNICGTWRVVRDPQKRSSFKEIGQNSRKEIDKTANIEEEHI